MAIKAKESTDSFEIKKYIGVGAAYVKGVNPTKEEVSAFYDRTVETIPNYVDTVEVNGVKIPQVRIDFLIETDGSQLDAQGNPIAFKTKMSLFLRQEYRKSTKGTYQIIDKYGRTAWASEEEIANKQIPVYANGKPANIDKFYRKAFVGEEELVKFFIAYLNVPAPQNYINGEWVAKSAEELDDCEANLEKIADYFKGDFKELKTLCKIMPNNKVKVLFGVRHTDDGKQYQAVYPRTFLKSNILNYSRLDKEVAEAKAAGAFSSIDFEVVDLKEYKIEPTNFASEDNDPFGQPVEKSPWD